MTGLLLELHVHTVTLATRSYMYVLLVHVNIFKLNITSLGTKLMSKLNIEQAPFNTHTYLCGSLGGM